MLDKIYSYLKLRYFLYLFSLIAGWPCVLYLIGWIPHYTFNYLLLLGLCIIWLFIHWNKCSIPTPIFIMIFFQIVTWFLYYVGYNDTSYLTRIVYLLIVLSFLCFEYFYFDKSFFYVYNYWLLLQVILGSIGFILCIIGVLEPFFIFKEMDQRPGYFFGLFTTNTYTPPFVRVAGFFDEPGALACWGIYALLINKLFFDNKKIELILLIGLLITLSMAYFIQAALYIIFFMGKQKKKIILVIVFIFILLNLIASQSLKFESAIFGRFNYNMETGRLAGDNRSDLADETSKIFYSSPIIGVGASNLIEICKREKIFVGANPYTQFATDGLIGVFVTWFPFFYLLWLSQRNKKYRYATIICMIGFLQRPYDCTQLLYPLLSYTICLWANIENTNERLTIYTKLKDSISRKI